MPTLVGIFILLIGVASGVIMLNAKQIFKLGAKADTTPKNIIFSNIEDNSFTLSFVTSTDCRSSIRIAEDQYFLKPVAVDKQDIKTGTHYFNIENLSAEKDYYLVINIDGTDYFTDNPKIIKTGKKISPKNEGEIVYGKVYSKSGQEQGGAIVYVQSGNNSIISTKTSENGDFILNISNARTTDLASYSIIDEHKTTIQFLVQYGNLISSVSSYTQNARPLPPIILGSNLDARNSSAPITNIEIPTPSVYGATFSNYDYPFPIKNIFKERGSVLSNE